MLLFLASILEQLELSSDHVSKTDVHNARIGLMLTDNAVELVLHQIAKDKKQHLANFRHLSENYPHRKALDKAVLKSFEDKVAFARLENRISPEEAQTIKIMHEFRNEVYHAGLSHEDILPSLSRFYLHLACTVIGRFDPGFLSWGSGMTLPERAKKYFRGHSSFPGSIEDFKAACGSIRDGVEHDDDDMIAVLADHFDKVVEHQSTCIDIAAGGVYEGQKATRDGAVLDSQTWPLAFSDEGQQFAAKYNWSGSTWELVDYLAANYPFTFRKDPISSWEKQARNLRGKRSAHAALHHYNSFMLETAALRDCLEQAAMAVEAEIDRAIDRARGN